MKDLLIHSGEVVHKVFVYDGLGACCSEDLTVSEYNCEVPAKIVVERDGKLVALVQPDENYIKWDKESEDKLYEKLDAWKAKLLKVTNKNVSKASQVSSVEVMKEPFEKTATQKIRRFKYKESAPTVEEEQKEKK